MIKLKDILKESSKVQLHKIITAKDEPSFMTEEQWEKKWTTINESEKQLEELSERLVINESILEGVDHAWYKKPVYQGVMRKGIIKFVNSLTPNSRSAKLLNKYFISFLGLFQFSVENTNNVKNFIFSSIEALITVSTVSKPFL